MRPEVSVRRPDLVSVVRMALRISLGTAFLSAVADRFGWWGPLGQGSWGSMSAFADYTQQLLPPVSGWPLTVIVWTVTVVETSLGVLLLTGKWPKYVGAAACLVLTVFGIAMAVGFGAESPFSYSVFSAASAAAAYAVLGTTTRPHVLRGIETQTHEPGRKQPDRSDPDVHGHRIDVQADRAARMAFADDPCKRRVR